MIVSGQFPIVTEMSLNILSIQYVYVITLAHSNLLPIVYID